MIHIVDYGLGNIQAFVTTFKRLGINAVRAKTTADLDGATHLILPGVGHFDQAMRLLNSSGMRPKLSNLVLDHRVPVIGICVGMQILTGGSEEGSEPGLNWIPGRVRAFSNHPKSNRLPMPHMGWNDVQPTTGSRLFASGFSGLPQFYFLHSYYFDPECSCDVEATAHYGFDFSVVVSRDNIYGVQCHPEKSHHWGSQLLKNFAGL